MTIALTARNSWRVSYQVVGGLQILLATGFVLALEMWNQKDGAEVSLGTWTYSLLTEARGIAPAVAGLFAGSYWATFTVGRMVAGVFAKRMGVNLLVTGGVVGALLGSLLLAWNPFPAANLLAVALVGFSIAPIFPAMMSGTSQRVGARFAANTIGMQMASAGLGTVFITSLVGVLACQVSLEVVSIALVVVFTALLGFYTLSRHAASSGSAFTG
ncbi:MAG: hypothetical protein Fur0016_11720 [Anaerolineales bacterium]